MKPTRDTYLDLITDAEQAERQAEVGPFYPAQILAPSWAPKHVPAITRESLLAYARECREQIAKQFPDGPPTA